MIHTSSHNMLFRLLVPRDFVLMQSNTWIAGFYLNLFVRSLPNVLLVADHRAAVEKCSSSQGQASSFRGCRILVSKVSEVEPYPEAMKLTTDLERVELIKPYIRTFEGLVRTSRVLRDNAL